MKKDKDKAEDKETVKVKGEYQFTIENAEVTALMYPKLEWVDDIEIWEDAVIVRSHNVRSTIYETKDSAGNDIYWIMNRGIETAELPDCDHPAFYCKKIRATKWGNLYETQRMVRRDNHNKVIWALNAFLEMKSEASIQIWTHDGKTTPKSEEE